jgi:hypothetical protein
MKSDARELHLRCQLRERGAHFLKSGGKGHLAWAALLRVTLIKS